MMKQTKAITLISLVITVVVLLIISGVAISIATNSDGIFGRAGEATRKWNTSVAGEAATMDNLLEQLGVINWEKAMAEAAAPESQDEARNNGVIGIGTDGKPVDMDLWEYTLMEDGTYGLNDANGLDGSGSSGRSAGYLGGYNSDGTIQGTVPTYISADNGVSYKKVTSMVHTFYACDDLVIAPEIPETVENMQVAFYKAGNLKTPPSKIPDSVTNLSFAFSICEKLEKMPELGKNIINMQSSFRETSINEVNVKIPDNVTNMKTTFQGCTSLQEFNSSIPNGVTNMFQTFQGCTSLQEFNARIPSSVTNMFQAFSVCPKLEGTMNIDASIDESIVYEWNNNQYKGYEQCFYGSCQEGNGLIIKGTCEKLGELRNGNTKITIE